MTFKVMMTVGIKLLNVQSVKVTLMLVVSGIVDSVTTMIYSLSVDCSVMVEISKLYVHSFLVID